MTGPGRTRTAVGETTDEPRGDDSDTAGPGDIEASTTGAEGILAGDGVPAVPDREVQSLSDIARDPLAAPFATLGAVLILAAVGYQAVVATTAYHPVVGLLVLGAAGGAYLIAKRVWAVQHRYLVRDLARTGDLDDWRD